MPFFLSLLLSLVVFVDPSFAQEKPRLDCLKGHKTPLKIILVPDVHTCAECDAIRTKFSESPPARTAVLIEGRPMQSPYAKVDGWEQPEVHVLAGLLQSWLKLGAVYRGGTETQKRDFAFNTLLTTAINTQWAETVEAVQLQDLGFGNNAHPTTPSILNFWKTFVRDLVMHIQTGPTAASMDVRIRGYRDQAEQFHADVLLAFAGRTSEAMIRKAIQNIQAAPGVSDFFAKGALDKVILALDRKLSTLEFQTLSDNHFDTYVIGPRDKVALVHLAAKICALKHSVDTFYFNAGALHIEGVHDGLEAMAKEAGVSIEVDIDRTSLFSHPGCRSDKTNPALESFVRRYFGEK